MHSHDETQGHGGAFRSFLYCIYALFNAVAFTAFFYFLFLPVKQPTDYLCCIGTGAFVLLGFFAGVLRPLFHR